MDIDEIILQQYQIYSESKEKFIDRTFRTNKFYMVLVIALLLFAFVTRGLSFARLTAPTLFSIIGIICCSLWWLNMDAYNCLIKIKFSKVLEENLLNDIIEYVKEAIKLHKYNATLW